MENIQLDIRKATQFLNAGVVEGYESKVKEAQEALETLLAQATISWDGFICPQR